MADFTYVLLPCDGGEAPTELSASRKTGDRLPDLLKTKFGGGSIKNADVLRAEYGAAVDEKMEQLNIAAAAGSVEVFALVRPSETTMPVPHAGTYFYFDEMGVLKDKPVNRRAMHLAKSCGIDVESPFLCDIFIGRVCIDPTPMHNVNFSMSELDSGSAFIASAPSENAQYQMAMGDYEKAAKEATAKATGRAEAGSEGSSSSSEAPLSVGQYKWSQTPDDLEVTISLPDGTAKKDLAIKLNAKSISVQLKSADKPLVDLNLFARVLPDESTWTLGESGGLPHVAIMVEKAEGVTWNRLEAASEGTLT